MFLRRLELENFRAIERLDMPFALSDGETRKWTLLLGENGCGKSTVLRAIALLLAGSDALPELLGGVEGWIRQGSDACALGAELVTAAGEERRVRLVLRRSDMLRDVFERNRDALAEVDRAAARGTDAAPAVPDYFVAGYGVTRRLSAQPAEVAQGSVFRQPRARRVATLFSPDAALNPLERWALDLHYRRGERGLRVVREALSGLLPDATFQGVDKESQRLLFRTADGVLPLGALSDGYQTVAGWGGDLLYHLSEAHGDGNGTGKDLLAARGLLLVDEIGLHLHPVWQRQLVDFLTARLPNFQIVGTTQSPLTAQQAGTDELFVLRREAAGGPPHLFQFQGEPRTMMLHQLLTSPVFGLETVDSLAVERMREEYRRLQRGQPPRSRSGERAVAPDGASGAGGTSGRLEALRRELEDLPDWSAESPSEARRRALLERIDAALAPANGTARAAPEPEGSDGGSGAGESTDADAAADAGASAGADTMDAPATGRPNRARGQVSGQGQARIDPDAGKGRSGARGALVRLS
jgi:hypothetical protein